MKKVLLLAAGLACSTLLTACQQDEIKQSMDCSDREASQETMPSNETVAHTEAEYFLAKLDAIKGDYTHEDILGMNSDAYYFVEKTCGNLDFLIFKDAASFLEAFGFAEEAPFCEIYANDKLQLTLYYDEETQLGCGDDGAGWGFCFLGCEKIAWDKFPRKNYMEPVTAYGDPLEDYMGDAPFDVITKYDAEGRLAEYQVTGATALLEAELGDAGGMDDAALGITYEYHPNGELAYRTYFHNPFIFGTTLSSMETWFDKQGRPTYEQAYITHGSLNWYYIYEDEDNIPEYILYVDHNGGDVEFSTTITPDSKN